jgi:hypothetical protein
MDEEEFKPGDLVFLTKAYEDYFRQRNPTAVHIFLTNRLAKIEKIIDWESEDGKKIKKARIDSGKWEGLPLEDSRYLLSIYFHDLVGRKGQQGVVSKECLFKEDPQKKEAFFVKVPNSILKEIIKKCEKFEIKSK